MNKKYIHYVPALCSLFSTNFVFKIRYFPPACGGAPGIPTNNAQTGRRSVCGEDALDEAQLKTEYQRLKRQMHIMEVDKRVYSEEVCNAIRKQQ